MNEHVKESVKSVLLVVLLVLALVLTYLNILRSFFLFSEPSSSSDIDIPIASSVLPKVIYYCDGSRYFAAKPGTLFEDRFLRFFVPVFHGAEVLDSISKQRFVEEFQKKSILFKLSGLSKDFFTGSGELGDFFCYDEILINDEGYFVRLGDQYYRVSTDEKPNLNYIIVAMILEEGTTYRRAVDRYSLVKTLGPSEQSLNYHLIPYDQFDKVSKSTVKYEFTMEDRSLINEIAKKMIGDRLEFTQIFVDSSNSIVFVYNKGQKSLTFKPHGGIHYKSKIGEKMVSKKTDFETALRTAVAFISRSGGVPEGMLLEECSFGEKGEYIFQFSYQQEYRILGRNCGIKVAVGGDVVLEMERYVVVPDPHFISELKSFTPVDQCISNHPEIFSLSDSPDFFYNVCSMIEDVSTVYVQLNGELVPTWHVRVDGKVYLFDIETGRYLERTLWTGKE